MSLKVVNIFTFDLSIRVNSFVSWFYFLFLFVNSNLKQYHNSSFSIFLLVLFWTKYANYLCVYVKLSMTFCHRQIPGRKSSRCHNLLIYWLKIIIFIFFPIQLIGIHPRTCSGWWRWRRSWQWTLKEIHFNSSVFGSSFYSFASDILSQSGKIPLRIQLVKKWTWMEKMWLVS
jgi:hypothetical protein